MHRYVGLCWIIIFVVSACDDTPPPPRPSDAAIAAYADNDGDGFSLVNGDCDDFDSTVHPHASEVPYDGVDQDCDGADLVDVDGDGHESVAAGGDDCDDLDDQIHPARAEVPYNGKDDDCQAATIDDDIDGDGFGKRFGGDCDDDDETIFPGADEVPYDDIDQDCDGSDLKDFDRDGFVAKSAGGDDCDDKNHQIYPGALDYCGDTIDQDCDGTDVPCSDVDKDGDGYSPADGDCDEENPEVHPGATELPYNRVDDDCDPDTRDDDRDRDGFSKLKGGDCDDDDDGIFPGAPEIPYDGVDQDCNGGDEVDVDGDGYTALAVTGGDDCDDLDPKVNPAMVEIPYDNTDQDCDGTDVVPGAAFEVYTTDDSLGGLDLAFNGTEHLMAWKEGTTIYGQRLDVNGQPVGDRFEITATASSAPKIASNGQDFLVGWQLMGGGWQVKAATVSASGAVGPTIDVDAQFIASAPSVAWAGGYYLVAYSYLSPMGFVVMGQRITAAGAAEGTPFLISSGDFGQTKGLVAGQDKVLVLGTLYWLGGAVIGRLVNMADGAVEPADGAPVIVSDAERGGARPAGAFDGSQYLVTWQDAGNLSDVWGQRLDTAGAAIGTATDENFVISDAFNLQTAPKAAFCNGRFMVVFKDQRFLAAPALFGQRVATDGTLTGSSSNTNELLYAGGAPKLGNPKLSCGGGKLLLLWTETVATGNRISGLLVAP